MVPPSTNRSFAKTGDAEVRNGLPEAPAKGEGAVSG